LFIDRLPHSPLAQLNLVGHPTSCYCNKTCRKTGAKDGP